MRGIDSKRQAIRTRYLCATNTKGSRVKADYAGGSIIRSWRDELSVGGNHAIVAHELASDLGWDTSDLLVGGWFGADCYWVLIDREELG